MNIDKKLLFDLYWGKHITKSVDEISIIIGFSRHMTDKLLREFEIPLRSSGETQMLKSSYSKSNKYNYNRQYDYLISKYFDGRD